MQRRFANGPYLGLACMILTILPLFLVGGNKSVNGEQFIHWAENVFCTSNVSFIYILVLLVTPTGVLSAIYAALEWLKPGTNSTRRGDVFTQQNRHYLTGLFFIPLSLILIPGLTVQSGLYAAGIVWVAFIPSIASQLGDEELSSAGKFRRALHTLWWLTIGLLVTLYGAILHTLVLR